MLLLVVECCSLIVWILFEDEVVCVLVLDEDSFNCELICVFVVCLGELWLVLLCVVFLLCC